MKPFSSISKTLPLIFLLTLSLFFSTAASLSLTKIGSVDATGKNYTEWWYTNTSVTLAGTASDGSQVTVKIGDQSNQVNVSSGSWSYNFSGESKDYNVEISQGAEKIVFVLHLGQALPNNLSSGSAPASANGVPETGYDQIIAISLGVGIVLLASYFYFWGDTKRKGVFETKIIKD